MAVERRRDESGWGGRIGSAQLVSRGMSEHYRNKANETPRDVKITGSLSFAEGSSVVTFTPGNYY